MKLIKRAYRTTALDDFSRATVSMCLEALGIIERDQNHPRSHPFEKSEKKYRRILRFEGFWGQDRYDLEDIFKEAREKYLERIKEIHPDKNITQAKTATRIIAAWKQLEKLFKRHGYTL